MDVVGVAGAAVLAKEAMKWMVAEDAAPEPEDPNPTQYTWQPIPDPGYGFGGGALTPEEDYAAFYLVREMRERNNDDGLRLERAIERAGSKWVILFFAYWCRKKAQRYYHPTNLI